MRGEYGRALDSALDIGQHSIRRNKLGVVQSSSGVVESLRIAGYIDKEKLLG